MNRKFELTDEQKQMLDKREKDILEGKVKTTSWEEIKAGLKRKKK